MKMIDLSKMNEGVIKAHDQTYLEVMNKTIEELASISLSEALNHPKINELDELISRAYYLATDDNEHDLRQLKRKIHTTIESCSAYKDSLIGVF